MRSDGCGEGRFRPPCASPSGASPGFRRRGAPAAARRDPTGPSLRTGLRAARRRPGRPRQSPSPRPDAAGPGSRPRSRACRRPWGCPRPAARRCVRRRPRRWPGGRFPPAGSHAATAVPWPRRRPVRSPPRSTAAWPGPVPAYGRASDRSRRSGRPAETERLDGADGETW
ncbi:conserved hypothetical protein [Ricinus communis]|uniref:Uncharacterized protein n=1 Tax=Ricinus communis TaxID=3988 RepID=B9TL13_RICCO|nr:conserved hypothetical protein [Ricinus communis]